LAGSRNPVELTHLLKTVSRPGQGREAAVARIFPIVYDELLGIARHLMRSQRRDSTLRPTALVHEAYLHLVAQDGLSWESRAHFFGIASRAMRQILVDHAREKAASKRGGGLTRVTLDETMAPESVPDFEVLDLDKALEKLATVDPRAARVVEMRVFAGLAMREVAHVLGVSKRTADEDWAMARLFLTRELTGGA